jgi:crossover junction endodeoxyribonuclease RuvC
MIVFGIDPGAANTGFGVVRTAGTRMAALDGGVIETLPTLAVEQRLAQVHSQLSELLGWHQPDAVALEDLFFGKNVGSALSVGQARGVALLAAGERQIACFDYTPQAVKNAVCGAGAASKEQVQQMVAGLLGLPEPPSPDHAADAFAVAICHAGHAGRISAVAGIGRPAVGTTPATRQRVAG